MAADGEKPGSWWQTIPGIITGIAGLLGSLAVLLTALNQLGLLHGISSTPSASPSSAGTPAKSTVTLPSVTGVPFADARQVLKSLGFTDIRTIRKFSSKTPGTVIEQVPNPGTDLPVDQLVSLMVAAHPPSSSAGLGTGLPGAVPTMAAAPGLSSSVVSRGDATLRGTWFFDLDTGRENEGPGDIWWEQKTHVVRAMAPIGGAQVFNLGAGDFDNISPAQLQKLNYSTAAIRGDDDNSNRLVSGDVFAVRTKSGNYAKVQILSYGYDLRIRWITYQMADR